MKKFRKKPVVIEAMQWDGVDRRAIYAWAQPVWQGLSLCNSWYLKQARDEQRQNGTYTIVIPTLEGELEARPGDWIIKGVKGEFYPCKPDIFAATYDAVDEATQ